MPAVSPLTVKRVTSAMVRQERAVMTRTAGTKREASFFDWSVEFTPEPKAGKLDFERFPFQVDLYKLGETDREAVIMKSTQLGISAYLVRWTLYLADVRGWTVLYVFPKQAQMNDFSDQRVRPVINASEYLRGRIPKTYTQNKGLKQVGRGFVVYRGSESEEGLLSVDADALALDEYDRLTPAHIPVVEKRITGSLHGLIRRVGVPSYPEYGIAALYDDTDQRRWFVKCGCGEWQTPGWEHVDQERMLVVCVKCRKPLDVAAGEWVPTFTDREVMGYHVPRLIVPDVARNARGMLADIVKASKKSKTFEIQEFHNSDLGVPWASEETKISHEAIRASQERGNYSIGPWDEGYQGDGLVTMGVDVASVRALNVRISVHHDRTKKALWIGEVATFDDLDDLMRLYRVRMACVDHLPEGRLARSFAERHPGLVYLVKFAETSVGAQVISVDEPMRMVTLRRTEAIDTMMSLIREQRNMLPRNLPHDYVAHLRALTRMKDEDEFGKVTVRWHSTAPIDYAMSEVYDVAAREAFRYRETFGEIAEEHMEPLEASLEFARSHLDAVSGESPDDFHSGPSDDFDPASLWGRR